MLLLLLVSLTTVVANLQYAQPPQPVVPYFPQQPQQQQYHYQQDVVQQQPQQYAIQLGNRATVTNCKACAWCCIGNVPIRRVPIGPAPSPVAQTSTVFTYGPQQQQQQTRQVTFNQVVSRGGQQVNYAPYYTQQQQQPVPSPVAQPVYLPRQVVQPQPIPQQIPQQPTIVQNQVYRPAVQFPGYQVAPQPTPVVINHTQTSYVQPPPPVVVPPCQPVVTTTTPGYVAPPPPPCQTTTTTIIPFYVTPSTTTTTTTTTTPPPPPPTYPTVPAETYATPPTFPLSTYVQPPTYVPVPLPPSSSSYRTSYPFDILGGASKNCCYLKIHNVEATVSCGTSGTQCCANPLSTCENARNVTVYIPREILNLPPTVITCEEAVRRGFINPQVFEGLCPASPIVPTPEVYIPSTNQPSVVGPTDYVLPHNSGLENSSTITTITAALTIVIAMFL